ncbi:MAG: helix-turn-helix transcriptional regulator [Lutibacter sp.]|jgi:AraC-like DNA-binding protein|uniref:helix-turn-helix domain-containing protein n=1 Tax=Lutibacter sp. TaxID=1925666 RepID=UPI0018105842|nr:AraC family transcriptional regulator [Lutibacter sp.]MBT8317440.1 AraC family transcriptional regulator [Lutibacter sp.]NNJ58299.1 helix-turn-helix transcriptional regulator [Lutibacter sp.]
MKSSLENYKNIDKSTQKIFDENNTFKVFHFNNLSSNSELYQYPITKNCIHLYFPITNQSKVAFNFEHCAVNLTANNSNMVYFKDEHMNLLFNVPPQSELIVILISLEYFHSLFSIDGNLLFKYNSLKGENPIIEAKEINSTIKLILNQITTRQTNEVLRPIFIKGKVYELLSYYFSTTTTDNNSESCPYIANEETISKIKHAKQLIIKEMINPPSLAELAKEVGLNIKKLKSEFKEVYGVPVFTFLLNYKMELGKQLLLEQQLNVNEIALQLGYSTSSHFIAAFKRKYGITPKQFSKS